MATNPDKQNTLRQEIMQILPHRDLMLSNMPYLRECLKEALRLSSVFVSNVRSTGQDLVLNGYQVPKGTNVVMSLEPLLNSNAYYENYEEYIPERWLKNTESTEKCTKNTINSFVHLPLGFVPRSCIEHRFAEMDIFIAVIRILSENFK